MIRHDRLVTPREHQAVLVEPPAAELAGLVRGAVTGERGATLLDTTVEDLRRELRAALDLRGPVILTGHQPEFSHAGVFAKTVATHALAATCGGVAVHLIADSDVPKQLDLRIVQPAADGVRRVIAALPALEPLWPAEHQPRRSRAAWRACFDELRAHLPDRETALLDAFAAAALDTSDDALDFVALLTRGRVAVETLVGLQGVRQLRMSELARTRAFRTFAAHLLLHADAGRAAYNAAQAAYRQRHGVRSAQRPVPPLAEVGERVEVPLWITRPGHPRQRRSIAARAGEVTLFADDAPIGTMAAAELAGSAGQGEPWPVERDGWHVRPRALALSGFARLVLADLFVHGIGGAKYDEVTDGFVEGLLGVRPRPLCCVSATVYPDVPRWGVTVADVRAARHALRDLRWNPQRHVAGVPAELAARRAALLAEQGELKSRRRADRIARQRVFRDLRAVARQLLERAPERVAEYETRVRELETRAAADATAADRETFFALHRRDELEALVRSVTAAVCGGGSRK